MKITNIEIKQTQKGSDYKSCETDTGIRFNVFGFHSLYSFIEEGLELKPDQLYQEGKFWNLKDPNKEVSAGKGTFAKAQTYKTESITKAMDRKEHGIMLSSTARMATEMVVALNDGLSESEAKEKWQEWRSWFIQEWTNDDITNTDAF